MRSIVGTIVTLAIVLVRPLPARAQPEGDRDGDGILDSVDACPDAAEAVNGVDDADGCPDGGAAAPVPAPAPAPAPESAPASAPVASQRSTTATADMQSAVNLAQQGHYEEALTLINKALASEPDWPEALRVRAGIYANLAAKNRQHSTLLRAQTQDLERVLAVQPDLGERDKILAAQVKLQQRTSLSQKAEDRRRKSTSSKSKIWLWLIPVYTGIGGLGWLAYGASKKNTDEDKWTRAQIGGGVLLGITGLIMMAMIIRSAVRKGQVKRDNRVQALVGSY